MTLHAQHMKLVDRVNTADREVQKILRQEFLRGWLEGLEACGKNVGALLCEADMEQIERGQDRPMIGGVFL